MYRSLKFLYELGVSQERRRIAGELQRIQRQLEQQMDRVYGDLSKMPGSKEQKQKLEFQFEVDKRLGLIINSLFEPQTQYITNSSVMFPDDN